MATPISSIQASALAMLGGRIAAVSVEADRPPEAALPDTPQVKSGMCRGWIHEELVWKHALFQPQPQPQAEAP